MRANTHGVLTVADNIEPYVVIPRHETKALDTGVHDVRAGCVLLHGCHEAVEAAYLEDGVGDRNDFWIGREREKGRERGREIGRDRERGNVSG